MIEIIQHFLLQNATILHIYLYFLDTGMHSFHSGDVFVHTRTNLHIHLYAQTHYSDAHTTCEITQTAPKVSSKIFPIDSCAVYSSFVMFLFVSFIINNRCRQDRQ